MVMKKVGIKNLSIKNSESGRGILSCGVKNIRTFKKVLGVPMGFVHIRFGLLPVQEMFHWLGRNTRQ
jgi:hypothetical protein